MYRRVRVSGGRVLVIPECWTVWRFDGQLYRLHRVR